ncbi:nucleotidyltransferase domain-containing protein [Arthrobacter sp. H35-D1]|uniref:nucleotidyltransferase domain-containing protein n=1 Tax=Arthrobacter sp. H35-D1 TaxID=3046202 RepID=UPI0024BB3978|nr:nucleotidyltransferase domain-containing protein [Arthrobacter sp. H35-D1]MDJ0312025.1 nucleotidyltransferase domain-containing protein [Arthrobacter sp. H35-D1]
MQLQNPLRAICPALEADVLIVLADGIPRSPGNLVRESGVSGSVSGVRRCLVRLEQSGVVSASHVGNRMEYALNTRHMLSGLVVEASTAMQRFVGFLTARIAGWDEQPLQVTLFGSAARREMRNGSDIDLLFVVPDSASDQLYAAISDLAISAYQLTGNDVRPMVYEVSEIQPAPIFDSIHRDGVHVFGDSRWLEHRVDELMVA